MTKSYTQTSDDPYVRHHYKFVYTNGKSVVFDNYYDVQRHWFETPEDFADYVEVLDIPQKTKGFK
jgi:hypothetical protein